MSAPHNLDTLLTGNCLVLPTTEEHFSIATPTHMRGVHLISPLRETSTGLCSVLPNDSSPELSASSVNGSAGGMSAFAKPMRLNASTHNLPPSKLCRCKLLMRPRPWPPWPIGVNCATYPRHHCTFVHRLLEWARRWRSQTGEFSTSPSAQHRLRRRSVRPTLITQRPSRHRNRRNIGKRPFRPSKARICSHGARAFRASVAAGAPRLHDLCGSCAYAARVAETQRDICRRPGRRATSSAVGSPSMQRVDVHRGRRMAWHA